MRFLAIKFRLFSVALAAFYLGLTGCGGGTSSTTTTPPPKLGSMAGTWDFTVIAGKNSHPIAIDATLTQDNSGNLSGSGTVTATGPSGKVFETDILGSSLSTATDIAVDYLGDTCNGTDSGARTISGTINSSNQVSISYDLGGAFTATITGTLSNSANPPFSGTGTAAGPCGGGNLTITGVLASSLAGTYSGTAAADNTETISVTVTDTNGTLAGNGTNTKLGSFTLAGNTVGNAFSATVTFASSPGNSGPVFGYFDPQLGAKGSILLTSFQGGNATTCPNGVPIDNGSCLLAILAMQ